MMQSLPAFQQSTGAAQSMRGEVEGDLAGEEMDYYGSVMGQPCPVTDEVSRRRRATYRRRFTTTMFGVGTFVSSAVCMQSSTDLQHGHWIVFSLFCSASSFCSFRFRFFIFPASFYCSFLFSKSFFFFFAHLVF